MENRTIETLMNDMVLDNAEHQKQLEIQEVLDRVSDHFNERLLESVKKGNRTWEALVFAAGEQGITPAEISARYTQAVYDYYERLDNES